MHPTHDTFSESMRIPSVELLNRRLATAIDPRGQGKKAHRNVSGPSFIGARELFDKAAGEADGTVEVATEQSETAGAADSADLVAGILRGVDHQLWPVESHVAPK